MTERGEPDLFELTWNNGVSERLLAHQVTWPTNSFSLISGFRPDSRRQIQFMGEVDGKWTLLLIADESKIASVRNISKMGELVGRD